MRVRFTRRPLQAAGNEIGGPARAVDCQFLRPDVLGARVTGERSIAGPSQLGKLLYHLVGISDEAGQDHETT